MADERHAITAILEKFAPYVIGSAGGLLWIRGSWHRKIAIFVLGVATAYYGSDYVTGRTGIPLQLTGLLLGLFSMSIVDKVFEEWQEFQMGSLLYEFARKLLSLPPRDKK